MARPGERLVLAGSCFCLRGCVKTMSGRHFFLMIPLGLAAILACWFGLEMYQFRRLRSELRLAEHDFVARRYAAARDRLARLAVRWPGRGDVEYWLGVCELNEGNPLAAMKAWSRVPDNAAEAPRAVFARGKAAYENGAYALAETCLNKASRARGDIAVEGRKLLGRLYWITGRHNDYRQLLQREAESQSDPSQTLHSLWALDSDPYLLEGMTGLLEDAGSKNPQDDRVWLARADLAIHRGRYDEADSLLSRCEQTRPDDPAVWHARLQWARAAGRPEDLLRRHPPARQPVCPGSGACVERMAGGAPRRSRPGEGCSRGARRSATGRFCQPRASG